MSDEIKIEKGIPIKTQRTISNPIYIAAKQLEIGDSFLVPDKAPLSSIYSALNLARVDGTVRKVYIGGKKRFRVWRTA